MTSLASIIGMDTPLDPGDVDNPIARGIARGTVRLMLAHGIVCVNELPLPDGRRADLVGLAGDGRIVVAEIKSGAADFRADRKWEACRAYCDTFYFAVAPDFPVAILPENTGLILADRYGGDFVRQPEDHPLAPARRKAMTLRFARLAAVRLIRLGDPSPAQ